MGRKAKVWTGSTAIGRNECSECGKFVQLSFQIIRPPLHSDDPGVWACRSCMLDSSREIAAIDRRGDVLESAEKITAEMERQTAISVHIANRDRESARRPGIDFGPPLDELPLPDDYTHVRSALEALARGDGEFAATVTELRSRYEQAAFFTPKQMLLMQWRLSKSGIEHVPGNFVVSIRSEKEIAQISGFDDWRRGKLAPYLSLQQRNKFDF